MTDEEKEEVVDFTARFARLGVVLSAHGLAETETIPRNADDADLTRMLLSMKMVPGIVAGSGHSVTTAAEFTYAELHEPATATMRGLPPDDPTIDQGPAK
jgi:hypothetical protein